MAPSPPPGPTDSVGSDGVRSIGSVAEPVVSVVGDVVVGELLWQLAETNAKIIEGKETVFFS